jgi:phosphoglycerol transferase MdoB-like AlkP superfamily enzyme
MKNHFFLWCRLFIYWLILFFILRVLFLFFYIHQSAGMSFWDWIGCCFVHGVRMDCSAIGYLMLLPTVTLSFFFLEGKMLWRVIRVTLTVFLVVVLFLALTDYSLFQYWGFRLDSTPLLYIKTPKDAFASLTTVGVLLSIVGVFLVIFLSIKLPLLIKKQALALKPEKWYALPVFLVLASALILPIRGGIGIAPLNPGMAYFSNNSFANQAALNVVWNACYSLKGLEVLKNPYVAFDDTTAERLTKNIWTVSKNGTPVLQIKRPNVIIVILESFTGKLVGCVGGEKGVTPNLDSIAHTGILFNNFYSSSDRSDKGIVAVLSGFPSQPNTSIIKYPNKTASLPHLAKVFNNQGYNTSFYYGGDIDFASMRSYFKYAGYKSVISKENFHTTIQNNKWGVHDHVVFDRILSDLDTVTHPFFVSYFTLSSHEPFDVPMQTVFKGSEEPNRFRNSMYYTDKSLGEFIRQASHKKWWKNTLVIFVADHGSRHPNDDPNYVVSKFHIPMIWTGGALSVKDTVVSTFGGQVDIAPTLLEQLGLDGSAFKFGKNILDPQATSSAFFVYNAGVGCVTPQSTISYDLKGHYLLQQEGIPSPENLKISRAYVQRVYDAMIHMK